MLHRHADSPDAPLTPEDLGFLQGVFHNQCAAREITTDSLEAEALACALISNYRFGITEEAALLAGLVSSDID